MSRPTRDAQRASTPAEPLARTHGRRRRRGEDNVRSLSTAISSIGSSQISNVLSPTVAAARRIRCQSRDPRRSGSPRPRRTSSRSTRTTSPAPPAIGDVAPLDDHRARALPPAGGLGGSSWFWGSGVPFPRARWVPGFLPGFRRGFCRQTPAHRPDLLTAKPRSGSDPFVSGTPISSGPFRSVTPLRTGPFLNGGQCTARREVADATGSLGSDLTGAEERRPARVPALAAAGAEPELCLCPPPPRGLATVLRPRPPRPDELDLTGASSAPRAAVGPVREAGGAASSSVDSSSATAPLVVRERGQRRQQQPLGPAGRAAAEHRSRIGSTLISPSHHGPECANRR